MREQENDIDVDITDDELEEKIQEKKRHAELLKAIKGLATSLQKGDDKELVQTLNQVSSLIKSFPEKIQVNNSQPNVNVNQDSVIKAINGSSKIINDKQDKIITLLEKLIEVRMAEVELTPVRNYGVIQKVIAKTILPTKTKYQA